MKDAEFRTTSDESHIPYGKSGSHFSDTTLAFKCKKHRNKLPLPKALSWDIVKKNVTCRDWKFRYCCKEMWGEGESIRDVILVDKPELKQLFEGCIWRQYMSVPKIEKGIQGDNEAKQLYLNKRIKSKMEGKGKHSNNVCKGFALGSRFIDVRTNDGGSTPYDEVSQQNFLKVSAVYGFICQGNNCKDYKVKYCCNK